MIHNNIEFHNVVELQKNQYDDGLVLQRFAKDVRENMGRKDHNRGRFVTQVAPGCEIRFVTSGDVSRVFLSLLEEDGFVSVYKGDFFFKAYHLEKGVISTLHLEDSPQFNIVHPEKLNQGRFSSNVWRIVFDRTYRVAFYGMDTLGFDVRPPEIEETPRLKWLAYGSSITMGAGAFLTTSSYIQQAARRLKVDVYNKGLGGACLCEKEVADFLAEQKDWDFATLEIGVNMRGRFTSEEFAIEAEYLIRAVTVKNPRKPVVLITIFPNALEFAKNSELLGSQHNREYNRILRDLHKNLGYSNVHLIEGSDILSDFSGLTSDLIHPSDAGHILMGENLALKLKGILDI